MFDIDSHFIVMSHKEKVQQRRSYKVFFGSTLRQANPLKITCLALITIFALKITYHQVNLRNPKKVDLALGQIANINSALASYHRESGFYPTILQGLKALMIRPTFSPKTQHWRLHLNHVPIDPWGNVYHYFVKDKHAYVRSYGITSRPEGAVRAPKTVRTSNG